MNPLSVLFIGQHKYNKDGCQQTFGNHTSGNYTNVMNKFNTTLMIAAITAPKTITTATTQEQQHKLGRKTLGSIFSKCAIKEDNYENCQHENRVYCGSEINYLMEEYQIFDGGSHKMGKIWTSIQTTMQKRY